jgi:hypothetical protein
MNPRPARRTVARLRDMTVPAAGRPTELFQLSTSKENSYDHHDEPFGRGEDQQRR